MKPIIKTIWKKALELGFQFNESDAHDMWIAIKEHKSFCREKVCVDCYSVGISDPNCRCTYDNNYQTLELDFQICDLCGQIVEDGNPADTEFNESQFKNTK